MRSNYSRTKLSRLDLLNFAVFTFTDACGHQCYITYIHYISNIICIKNSRVQLREYEP